MKKKFKILGIVFIIASVILAVALFIADMELAVKIFFGLVIMIIFLVGTSFLNRAKYANVDEMLEKIETLPMPSTILVKKGDDDNFFIASSLKPVVGEALFFCGSEEERKEAEAFYDKHQKILGQFHRMVTEPFLTENYDHYERCDALNLALESLEQLKRYCLSQGEQGNTYYTNIYGYKPKDDEDYISYRQKVGRDWVAEKTYLDTFDHIAEIIDKNSPITHEKFLKKLKKVNEEYALFIIDEMEKLGTIFKEEKDGEVIYIFNREWMKR